MNLKYIVTNKENQKTVKYILKNKLKISERLIKKLKYTQNILCNSNPIHINNLVNSGDIIDVNIDFIEENKDIIPENIPIDIIYEDEAIIILNKQSNIVVHPTFNYPNKTLANALNYYFLSKSIHKKIRPINRLDKNTTGIIIFAKNEYIQENLIKQMQNKTFFKEYIGIAVGILLNKSGIIDMPIARSPESIITRQIDKDGQKSITYYEVLETYNLNSNNIYSVLKFNLETGRTHQIRVHCKAIGHPILGDGLYSDNETNLINRQALHAYKVIFIHPLTKKIFEITAPIPPDILNLCSANILI